jgi:hypothetical protein
MEHVVKAQEMNVEEIGAVAGGFPLSSVQIIGSIITRGGCPTCSRVALLPGNIGDPVEIVVG